jgi:signal transduction histidine kinase
MFELASEVWVDLMDRAVGLRSVSQVSVRSQRRLGSLSPALEFAGRYGGCFLGLVAAYWASAQIGYAFHFAGPVAAVVWLPVGVGIAGLYLFGLELWPAVVTGDLLVNSYSTLSFGSALGQSFGNLLEVLIGAWLLRRFASRKAPLSTPSGVGWMFVALAVATLVSSVVGPVSLALGHDLTLKSFVRVWHTWWLGDFCGALIVVPLVLAFALPSPRPWLRGKIVEALLLTVTLAALSTIALQGSFSTSYIAFPALMWAALRFGPRGTTLAIAVAASFTVWGATHDFGAFRVGQFTTSLLHIQLYLAVTAMSALAVAALATEREWLAHRVRASRKRLVASADEERRRLERDLHDGAQQRLIALAVALGRAARETREPGTPSEAAAASLEAAHSGLLEAIEELRELVHGIHPEALRRFGVARAIEEVAGRSAMPVEIVELPTVRFDEMAETTVYYVVLEAVNNAQRHAQASRARVRVRLSPAGAVELEVEDDGVGGAVERERLGLQGLRDRVETTGGSFLVDSQHGRGTRIRARIPATRVSDGHLAGRPD